MADQMNDDEMEAMAVWESHLQNSGEKWREGVDKSEEDYRKGFAEAMGVDPDSEEMKELAHKWHDETIDVSADEFESSIRDEGSDWLLGLYEQVTGSEASDEIRLHAEEIEQAAHERAGEDASGEELADAIHQEIQDRK